MEVAIKGSTGKLSALQQNILRSEQLRNYADNLKYKIDGLFNIYVKEIYRDMSTMNSRVPEEELNRFLLRIRQSSKGYVDKSYVSVKASGAGDTITITFSVRSVWRSIIGQRDIAENTWDMEISIPTSKMEEHRYIIRQFKPLIDDTCGFIKSCWGSLIETSVDNVDQYFNICAIKCTNIEIDL